jgi:hypothetical protein
VPQFVPPQPELERFRVRHRKNLAEWVMWCVLLPFVPIAWLVGKTKSR